MVRPKKYLGQNFLTDQNIAAKIVDCLKIQPEDIIIEIGSGKGILTDSLIKSKAGIIAVEIDNEAFDYLIEKYDGSAYGNLTLIKKDFLKFDIQKFYQGKKFKIIGNIPYYISGEIFFRIFENAGLISKSVLTVQKEVAVRVAAGPGSKDYGVLSVASSLLGNAKKEFDIKPGAFFPKPKITSSVVRLDFRDEKSDKDEFKNIMVLVKSVFGQRRKKLKNSLKNYVENNAGISFVEFLEKAEKEIKTAPDIFGKRPEQLEPGIFTDLYKLIQKYRTKK